MKELWKNLKFTWPYVKDHKNKLIKYVLCNVVAVAVSILIPILSARVIIELTSSQFYQMLLIGMVIFGVEIMRNLANHFASYYSQVIYRESFVNIQTALGKEIVRIENECIDANTSGLFIQRLTGDTNKMSDIFNILNMYVSNIVMDCGIFIAIFIINKILFIYLVVMVIILYLIDRTRVKKANEKEKMYRKEHENVTGFVGEIVHGIRDIKMLNAEHNFIDELHTKVVDLNGIGYKRRKIDRDYSLARNSSHDLFDLGMNFLQVFLLIKGLLTIPSALIIHNYMRQVTSVISYIGQLLDGVKEFNLSASRVYAIMDSKEFVKETFGERHIPKIEGDFAFENVTFHYESDKKKVLDDISFRVNANETVAFVGKSGVGKSTIFNLLCKMYNPVQGKITIDGIDVQELDKDTIRGNITVISQNPYIFHLSIRDNLRLVRKDITEEEMIEACKLACLHEFIMSLSN